MSSSPSATPGPSSKEISGPSRKRRKLHIEKESIYLVPDTKPYALTIKQRTNREARPSWTTGPSASTNTERNDGDQTGRERSRSLRSRLGLKQLSGGGSDGEEKKAYRARALKAWETKRQRQRERFEALESGIISQSSRSRATSARDGEDETPSALDPLLGLDLHDLPDNLPKDDLLQSIHAYAARYYSQSGLLLPEDARAGPSRQDALDRSRRAISTIPTPASVRSHPASREPTPTPDTDSQEAMAESSPDPMTMPLGHIPGLDDSDSEYSDPEDERAQADTSDDDVPFEPRKRGGQPGKRKLKDMYLALDGSALLAFGVLIQEHIIAHIHKEGYVPAPDIEADIHKEPTLDPGQFEVSDDESENADAQEELESEEGS